MAEVVENEEKVFDHFLELSTKVRIRMIDKMETADRCRLTRCSKTCNQEAKSSKYYIHDIALRWFSGDYPIIYVNFGKHEFPIEGFRLEHKQFYGITVREYRSLNSQTYFETELDGSKDHIQCAIEALNAYLQCYQKTVKKLIFHTSSSINNVSEVLKNIDFKINNLDNVESLTILAPVDVQQIFSKLRKPLKRLHLRDNTSLLEYFLDFKQIDQVQGSLTLRGININLQQMLRFSAKHVSIDMGKLTERDIFKFIRAWQNETLGKDIEVYQWNIGELKFDFWFKFMKFLRLSLLSPYPFEIKHFYEPGKIAKLHCDGYSVYFDARGGSL